MTDKTNNVALLKMSREHFEKLYRKTIQELDGTNNAFWQLREHRIELQADLAALQVRHDGLKACCQDLRSDIGQIIGKIGLAPGMEAMEVRGELIALLTVEVDDSG